MSLLKEISNKFNITVLCSLHNIEFAKKYSDRIIGLLNGEIKFNKSPNKLSNSELNSLYI
jgi:phosphonate transport system ATP-binding protein